MWDALSQGDIEVSGPVLQLAEADLRVGGWLTAKLVNLMCQGPSLCGALPRPHPGGPQQCAHVVRCSCKTCLQKGKSAVISTGGPALCLNPLPGCFCAFSRVQGVMSTRGVWRLRERGSWTGEACSWGHGICLWGSRSHLCRVKWPGTVLCGSPASTLTCLLQGEGAGPGSGCDKGMSRGAHTGTARHWSRN